MLKPEYFVWTAVAFHVTECMIVCPPKHVAHSAVNCLEYFTIYAIEHIIHIISSGSVMCTIRKPEDAVNIAEIPN